MYAPDVISLTVPWVHEGFGGDTGALLNAPATPPETMVHSTWTITRAGAPITCGLTGAQGVAITQTPSSGLPVTDIWDCDEPAAITEAPYGDFTLKAELLGPNDVPIGMSPDTAVDASRGPLAITAN